MKINTKNLASWIKGLMETAEKDECISISWFKDTEDSPIAIVGGWQSGYDSSNSDIFCHSKSHPEYAMCIKIAHNPENCAYIDYEMMYMPEEAEGEVDDTEITLEWQDIPEALADFFAQEYERVYKNYEKGVYINV